MDDETIKDAINDADTYVQPKPRIAPKPGGRLEGPGINWGQVGTVVLIGGAAALLIGAVIVGGPIIAGTIIAGTTGKLIGGAIVGAGAGAIIISTRTERGRPRS